MAVIETSGTQTAVIGTEHTLFTAATGYKTRVLVVDVSVLVATEVVELRVYSPVLASGTVQLVRLATFTGVVSDPNAQSFPFLVHPTGFFSLKQTSGTGRSFIWNVSTLD